MQQKHLYNVRLEKQAMASWPKRKMLPGMYSYLLAVQGKISFVLIVGKQTIYKVPTGDSNTNLTVPGQRGSQI